MADAGPGTNTRVAVFGATHFTQKCLESLLRLPQTRVTGVLSTPKTFSISYRPQGVTNYLHTNLQQFAQDHGIPSWLMTGKMSDPDLLETVRGWAPDVILVAGWYHTVPRPIRDIAPAFGLHASLLPDYAGGAPLVWALINGESRTGITLFELDDGIDSGRIVGQIEVPILLNDSIATLYAKIEKAGAALIVDAVAKLRAGALCFTVQDERKRRIWPQRSPEDGQIDWQWDALRVYNFIRAQTRPYPGAFTFLGRERVTVWEAKLYDHFPQDAGRRCLAGQSIAIVAEGPLTGLLVATAGGDHPILLTEVAGEDGIAVPARDFVRQRRLDAGSLIFGNSTGSSCPQRS